MRKVILLSILALALTDSVAGQGWRRLYGVPGQTEAGRNLVRTPDGGYLIWADEYMPNVSFSALYRLDADGALIWKHAFNDNGLSYPSYPSLVLDAVNDIFTLGGNRLYKFSADGAVQFALPPDTLIYQLAGLMPDGVVTRSDNFDGDTLVLRKYSLAGDLLWEIKHLVAKRVLDMKVAPDQKIWAITDNFGYDSVLVFHPDGTFQQSIYLNGNYKNIVFDAAGNTVLLGGGFDTPLGQPQPFYLKKITPAGQVLWNTTYKAAPDDYPDAVLPMPNGNYVLVGHLQQGSPHKHLTFYSLDSLGQELWKRQIITPTETILSSAVQHPDGSFAACGVTYESDLPNSMSDIALWKFNAQGLLYPDLLHGRVVRDTTADCIAQADEPGMAGWIVQVKDFLAVTGQDGRFEIQADSGASALKVFPPSPVWEACPAPDSVVFAGTFLTDSLDIPVFPTVDCPQMQVSIGFQRLRRCLENTATVSWCNLGTASTPEAKILVVLPPELDFTGSTWPVSQINGDSLWFDLGFVDLFACGSFQLRAIVNCDSTVLGQALCVEAHIFPDTFCLINPQWSGARIELSATCVGDTAVEFHLKNTGDTPTSANLNYIIIEDQVVLMSKPFSLPANGEQFILQPVTNGSLYRLEATQEPFYPGLSMPSVWVEGCGAAQNQGLSLQYPVDDRDLFVDIDCQAVTGSYDPNDKSAQPAGFDAQHLIEPNTDLTYRIRFQNTGTDTAFTVILRDTLAGWLDPTSIRPESASHPFSWNFSGGNVLKFTFDHILLPDSATNEAASQGFVQFRVSQKTDVPIGSVIRNCAAIYFDFNPAVITNETFHTVGRDYILVQTETPEPDAPRLRIGPNPFRDATMFYFDAAVHGVLTLYSPGGQVVRQEPVSGPNFRFQRGGLTTGWYAFDLRDQGRLLARGKIVVQ